MFQLFSNIDQSKYPIFGRFNTLYRDLLAERCPQLREFQILIFTVDDYLRNPCGLPLIDIDDNDAFAYSSDKQGDAISSTKAAIIFNESAIDRLGLTEEEQFAAIAHEIGHIIYRFSDNKAQFPKGQGEEIYSDGIAAEIGLAKPLLSLLEKLEIRGMFTDSESRFGMRKINLITFLNTSIYENFLL